jgi:hypothetical protein
MPHAYPPHHRNSAGSARPDPSEGPVRLALPSLRSQTLRVPRVGVGAGRARHAALRAGPSRAAALSPLGRALSRAWRVSMGERTNGEELW